MTDDPIQPAVAARVLEVRRITNATHPGSQGDNNGT